MKVNITANGEVFSIQDGEALHPFIRSLNLDPLGVIVQLNQEALTPSQAAQTQLKADDSLEIARIVAGG